MTPEAATFITPLTLSTLSKNPVHLSFVKGEKESASWDNHVELGCWADCMIVAPLTANTLAKMAHGQSDNFLVATYLSARCPVFVAPAMDLDMYGHPSTRTNLEILSQSGDQVIPSPCGALASGLIGRGRMAEPCDILERVEAFLLQRQPLFGKRVLLTAGPTHEPLDPIRFIGNHSSGKMGLALARRALELGAQVTVVLGPVGLPFSEEGLRVIPVQTASQMLEEAQRYFAQSDLFIAAAAVSDYRPKSVSDHKIKSHPDCYSLELVRNPDILKTLAAQKTASQVVVGFALETEDERKNAAKKCIDKKADCIVLNSLCHARSGFSCDTNQIEIISRDGETLAFKLKSKREVAADVFTFILQKYYASHADLA